MVNAAAHCWRMQQSAAPAGVNAVWEHLAEGAATRGAMLGHFGLNEVSELMRGLHGCAAHTSWQQQVWCCLAKPRCVLQLEQQL